MQALCFQYGHLHSHSVGASPAQVESVGLAERRSMQLSTTDPGPAAGTALEPTGCYRGGVMVRLLAQTDVRENRRVVFQAYLTKKMHSTFCSPTYFGYRLLNSPWHSI